MDCACQASLSFTIFLILLKLMSIELVMPSNHPIICCPLLLLTSVLPASGSFPMSQLFAWGGQSTGVSSFYLHLKVANGWWLWTEGSSKYCPMLSLGILKPSTGLQDNLVHHASQLSPIWPNPLYTSSCQPTPVPLGQVDFLTWSVPLPSVLVGWPVPPHLIRFSPRGSVKSMGTSRKSTEAVFKGTQGQPPRDWASLLTSKVFHPVLDI